LSQGRRVEDIISGIHKSIAKRIGAMVRKIGIKEVVFFDGGPAFNRGLKKSLEQELGVELYVPEEPQITTALGAAVIAYEHFTKNRGKTTNYPKQQETL
jgi:activator of 2-hydroxyglutaryl-CoA dehydratase